AFTGATAGKPGKFEVCHEGTIFLDEIAEMPASTQGKLLRVLETGEIEKLGSPRPVKVDVRVIAATNRDLRVRIDGGQFRADLYYRLRVVEIPMPRLSDRPEDIPGLVKYFVNRHAPEFGQNKVTVEKDAMEVLTRYQYPGNVRELENILRNCLVRLKGNQIHADDLNIGEADTPKAQLPIEIRMDDTVFDTLFEEIARRQPLPRGADAFDIIEHKLVLRALEFCKGNQSKAANFLGITRNTLRKRVKKYGVIIERSVTTVDA
ncbi:MAG: sigma 54-interacting transcriptional regulator, partial [Candidatus Sumerlaeaceae bacterium]|nr:sigma 54-interacting transcriptional regulator [Candidatus Sumerlaeaceae bacterium]